MSGKVSIRWTTDAQLSSIQAARVVATGSVCADRKTEQALATPITEINNRLLSASLDIGQFWQSLMNESVFDFGEQRACEIALMHSGCSELQLEQIANVIVNRLGESRMAFQGRFPKLVEQLDLRGRPIREHWDTVGPGLLGSIAKQIWANSPPADWWPTKVNGVLVQPMRGGDGGIDVESCKFWIEALLTNVDPQVPEVLRVAWLVTQLAIEIHTQERSSENSGSIPWAIGTVPLVLTAAKDLEILRGDELPIESAMQLWGLGDHNVAKIVSQWWQQQQKSPTPMPVGLKQLDQMLIPSRQPKTGLSEQEIDLSQLDF